MNLLGCADQNLLLHVDDAVAREIAFIVVGSCGGDRDLGGVRGREPSGDGKPVCECSVHRLFEEPVRIAIRERVVLHVRVPIPIELVRVLVGRRPPSEPGRVVPPAVEREPALVVTLHSGVAVPPSC